MPGVPAVPADAQPPSGWHAMGLDAVRAHWAVDLAGLSDDERERRRTRYGPNALQAARRRGPVKRLLLQFHNVLVYLMLAGSLITALLGHWIDASVLLVAILANVLIGFFQEGRAEAALEAIRAMLSPRAVILRAGLRLVNRAPCISMPIQ